MQRRAVVVVSVAVAGLTLAGCLDRDNEPRTAIQVARQYFDYMRDNEMDRAKALCRFEDEKAEKAWTQQMAAYQERREAGAPRWWGVPNLEQMVGSLPGGGQQAFIEVGWLYQVPDGWMMGKNYTYPMREAKHGWKMWISTYESNRGIPFVPGWPGEIDDEEEEE